MFWVFFFRLVFWMSGLIARGKVFLGVIRRLNFFVQLILCFVFFRQAQNKVYDLFCYARWRPCLWARSHISYMGHKLLDFSDTFLFHKLSHFISHFLRLYLISQLQNVPFPIRRFFLFSRLSFSISFFIFRASFKVFLQAMF